MRCAPCMEERQVRGARAGTQCSRSRRKAQHRGAPSLASGLLEDFIVRTRSTARRVFEPQVAMCRGFHGGPVGGILGECGGGQRGARMLRVGGGPSGD
eukprot:2572928-Lingulodinium_polyedra.AAC.1